VLALSIPYQALSRSDVGKTSWHALFDAVLPAADSGRAGTLPGEHESDSSHQIGTKAAKTHTMATHLVLFTYLT